MLRQWLHRDHVAIWWGPPESIEELREYCQVDEPPISPTQAFIAWHSGQPIGFIQAYSVQQSGDGWWPDETDPGARGIDQFIADDSSLGKGLGSSMIAAFVEMLLSDPSVTFVQADPSPENERAIRCYERVGFQKIGIVNTPDGAALLMKYFRPKN